MHHPKRRRLDARGPWEESHLQEDLMAACRRDDLERVRELVELRADVGVRDPHGWTPLAAAVESSGSRVVQLLCLESRANPNAMFPAYTQTFPRVRVHLDWNALMLAARNNNLDAALALIASRSNLRAKDAEGFTPLIIASQHGSFEVMNALLEAGAEPLLKDKAGHDAFSHAVVNHEFKIASALLQANATPSPYSEAVLTPLIRAAKAGDLEAARYLVTEAKALLSEYDKAGSASLAFAAHENKLDMCRYLLDTKAQVDARDVEGRTPAMRAAERGNLTVLQLLVDSKADIRARASTGRSMLMEGARKGRLDVLGYLLRGAGAPVDATDALGRTALLYACKEGKAKAAMLLLSLGANHTISSLSGHTGLHLASRMGHVGVVRIMISGYRRKSIDKRSAIQDHTALMLASKHGHKAVVQELLNAKAAIEARSNRGRTSLMYAARHGRLSAIECLSRSRADTNARSEDGKTVLIHAASGAQPAIIRFLLKNTKPDLSLVDNRGRSALHYALLGVAMRTPRGAGIHKKSVMVHQFYKTCMQLLDNLQVLTEEEIQAAETACYLLPVHVRKREERKAEISSALEGSMEMGIILHIWDYDDPTYQIRYLEVRISRRSTSTLTAPTSHSNRPGNHISDAGGVSSEKKFVIIE